jgi:sec-independent protein translocase protein TatC
MTAAASSNKRRQRRDGMTLASHLLELRKRLFVAAIAIVVATVLGWFLTDIVWDALREPITRIAEARNATINYSGITSAFDISLQIAVTIGIVVGSPVWLYQIFAFLAPGLSTKEKRYTFGFFFSAVPLFAGGCASGWLVVPHIVELMASFVPAEDASIVEAKIYLDFVLKLLLATGVAFVLPVFVVLLNFMGVLSAASVLKGWRVAILLIVLFTAIATPAADLLSMFALAVPMIGLYFSAAGIAAVHDRRTAKAERQLEAGLNG